MEQLVLATKNEGKLVEMRELLAHLPVEVLSLKDLGITKDAVEDAETFRGNAEIKARFYGGETGLPAIADDSGLSVDALGGEPGVHSARYAGVHGDDAANNEKLISEMTARGLTESSARYVCAIVFHAPDGTELTAEGVCRGRVVLTPRGDGGFGYDPYFIPAGMDKRMAELTLEEKQAISHRGKAMREMLEKLEDYYGRRDRQ